MPKYPNKKKRKEYYKVYFRAKTKDLKKVWDFLDEIINELGNPFTKAKTGRPPNFVNNMQVYVKICIFLSYFDFKLDEMESLIQLMTGKKLHKSNIDRWFMRYPEEYSHMAGALLHSKIEKILDYGDYVTDATKISTTRYEKLKCRLENTLKLTVMGLHIVIQYYIKEGFLSIVCFEVTDGESHESPIFRNQLLEKGKFQKNRRMFGDKGFPSEKTFKKLFELELIPQICQKETTENGFYTNKAKKLYINKLRKQIRGLVEGVFGGMETETGNRTRFVLDKTRKNYISIRALSHEIRTYFRVLEYRLIQLFISFATTPEILLKTLKELKS